MLDDVVKEYAEYFKLDVSREFQTVQDVIDNMLTRLEELTSVLQMIKLKNKECGAVARGDVSVYRSEITGLSKKVATVNEVILKLQSSMDMIEKQIERAEFDFGIQNDNKIKTFLKPFLLRKPATSQAQNPISPPRKVEIETVMNYFENN